ncbi:MAG: cytochrome c oxidase subunit II [Pirellulaceae bacterium]
MRRTRPLLGVSTAMTVGFRGFSVNEASQSVLDPAGLAARQIAELFYWMVGGATLIWMLVIGLAVYAIFSRKAHPVLTTRKLVIGGGAIFPTVVLTGLLAYGLSLMPDLHRPAPAGSLKIRVSGVRWWWRVEYFDGDGNPIETANEVRLPVDQPIAFELLAEDVIHSFWIPPLGGKMDMLPGRSNWLTLHPDRQGDYFGVCAEYCGTAHAQMRFSVVVSDEATFADWLATQGLASRRAGDRSAASREEVFLRRGCSACHTIRGTAAKSRVGPDLTHFGTRRTIGAGILPNTANHLSRWIVETHRVKPGVEMPSFRTLANDPEDLSALVAYLESLQ